MTKKQIKEQVLAMMFASGLTPVIEDDYYENLNGSTIGRFCEALRGHFSVEHDCWALHFANLDWIDTPSETVEFWVNHAELINT